MEVLAKGCLGIDQRNATRSESHLIKGFCDAYQKLRATDQDTNDPKFPFFFHRFSLRDFYHCLRFFRRKSLQLNNKTVVIDPELTLQSLERNFNGLNEQKKNFILLIFLKFVEQVFQEKNFRRLWMCFSLVLKIKQELVTTFFSL